MNMPRSIRAEGVKGNEETGDDGSRLKLGNETQWKGTEHVRPVGRRDALLITKRWDKQDRVNTDSEKPQEEEHRVQKGLFASNNRIYTLLVLSST